MRSEAFTSQYRVCVLLRAVFIVRCILDTVIVNYMNQFDNAMKKSSSINLDRLIEDYSLIEQKIAEINGKHNILEIQLEKSTRLLKLSETKETSIIEDCGKLQKVTKGLQDAITNQCNLRDENERLKNKTHLLEEKLNACQQEYKNRVDLLVAEIRAKEEEHKVELINIRSEMQEEFRRQEEKQNDILKKKEMECIELTRQLKTQEKEKQNEIIKLQIEFNAKLSRQKSKSTKSYPDTPVLPQHIYRMKLQHLQDEKNKEIESLRNSIKNLQQQLSICQDSQLKRKRF
ncbi:coiled-coil domain-containing protein 152 isoform X1 [Lissotriton helveticus]